MRNFNIISQTFHIPLPLPPLFHLLQVVWCSMAVCFCLFLISLYQNNIENNQFQNVTPVIITQLIINNFKCLFCIRFTRYFLKLWRQQLVRTHPKWPLWSYRYLTNNVLCIMDHPYTPKMPCLLATASISNAVLL